MDQILMKEKSIWRLVFIMSVPNVLSMLVNSLYNIVDSFFVAQISENAMTALSFVFPIQNLVTSIGVGFGVGINAVIALSWLDSYGYMYFNYAVVFKFVYR